MTEHSLAASADQYDLSGRRFHRLAGVSLPPYHAPIPDDATEEELDQVTLSSPLPWLAVLAFALACAGLTCLLIALLREIVIAFEEPLNFLGI